MPFSGAGFSCLRGGIYPRSKKKYIYIYIKRFPCYLSRTSSFNYNFHMPFQIHILVNTEPLMANADAIFCVQLQFNFVKVSAFLWLLVSVLLQLTLTVVFKQSSVCNYCFKGNVWTATSHSTQKLMQWNLQC